MKNRQMVRIWMTMMIAGVTLFKRSIWTMCALGVANAADTSLDSPVRIFWTASTTLAPIWKSGGHPYFGMPKMQHGFPFEEKPPKGNQVLHKL
jgi:hypothetical protein